MDIFLQLLKLFYYNASCKLCYTIGMGAYKKIVLKINTTSIRLMNDSFRLILI